MIISDYFKAAHEVKNTISLVCANIELLELDENNQAHARKYRLIKNELIRIHDLMVDILRFANEDPINKTKLNPRNILRELVYEYYESLGYSFNYKFDAPAHEVYILGDRTRIRQVFSNIISNALQHEASGRRLYLLIKIEVDSRFVKITISDNGAGFQQENAVSRPDDGNIESAGQEEQTEFSNYGLGLLISKCIIAEHDGFLDIQSEPGTGTIVSVSLPSCVIRA